MSDSSQSDKATKADDNDQLICFCHTVTRGQIKAAIRAGATSLERVQSDTCASTGCGGCECDVRDILDSELSLLDPAKKTG